MGRRKRDDASFWRGNADGTVRCVRCGQSHKPCYADTTKQVVMTNGKLGFAHCMRPEGHAGPHHTRCQCLRLDTMTKAERLERANKLLVTIGSYGRHFFTQEYGVAQFELDDRGRLWFRDHYTRKRIYVAYHGRWKHFTGGGTLRALVEALCDYIRYGDPVPPGHFGPWPEYLCDGDVWGYGKDMALVRKSAQELGILREEKAG